MRNTHKFLNLKLKYSLVHAVDLCYLLLFGDAKGRLKKLMCKVIVLLRFLWFDPFFLGPFIA